ncbi:MAG TPA: aldo/keto reductase, partial [Bacillota bacterium]|nr:aldo/keto reductase [Bacillota bacterium]
LQGIPEDSRAASGSVFLKPEDLTDKLIAKVVKLNELAKQRGQKLAQMALAWVLRDRKVTSVLIGASKVSQITDCVAALNNLEFTQEELESIDEILKL